MGIYIMLCIYTIGLYFFTHTVNNRGMKSVQLIYAWIMGITLFIIVAFRDITVGGDLVNYLHYYRSFSEMNLVNAIEGIRWEAGYITLNKIVALISNASERALLVVVALITTLGITRFIYKYSKVQWLSWYLYITMGFLIYPLSGLRAAIAMVIGLNGIGFLVQMLKKTDSKNNRVKKKRPWIGYYLNVFFATPFHNTAIVYSLLYPLCKLRLNLKYYLTLTIFGLVGYLYGGPMLNYLANNFYPSYVNAITVSDGGYGLFLLIFLVLISGIIIVPKQSKESPEYKVYNHILSLALVLQIITLKFSLFSRIVEFLSVTIIIYIPFIISKMRKEDQVFAVIFVCLASLFLFYGFLSTDSGGVVPYKLMWN